MTENTDKTNTENADDAKEAAPTPENMEPDTESAAPDEMDSPAPEEGDEAAKLRDRLLRAMADAENTRRRAERQVSEASQYAVASFARDMLNVADNLRRALDAVPETLLADEAAQGLVGGVEMTERELLATLERHGIRKISPMGEKFDHNFHQAIFEVEDPAVEPGTVVQVVQDGYVIRSRLLRPAMVGVAKTPKAPPEGVDTTA